MSSTAQIALRKDIATYIGYYSKEVPETQKARLLSNVEQKVKSIAKEYMDQAKASVDSSNSRTFISSFSPGTSLYLFKSAVSIFQQVLKSVFPCLQSAAEWLTTDFF